MTAPPSPPSDPRDAGAADPAAVALDRLRDAVDRLAAALRQLDPTRLGRPPRRSAAAADALSTGDPQATSDRAASVADLAHELSVRLAAVQLAAGDRPTGGPGGTGPVPPRLADHACGDQLAVVGRDAERALRSGPVVVVEAETVDALAERLRQLRLRL